MKQLSEMLTYSPWRAIYAQRGTLQSFNNTSFRGCSAASLLIMSQEPLWVFAVDSGGHKEVEVNLDVSIDDKFGQKEHEALFQPSRSEVKTFPEFCRMDLFLNKKLSTFRKIRRGGSHLLRGVVLANCEGNRLGLYADENSPGNILLTTDSRSIDLLHEQDGNTRERTFRSGNQSQ
ncbi:MAG: hypothetical protein ACO3JG_03565 [Luteolibacter sp.]